MRGLALVGMAAWGGCARHPDACGADVLREAPAGLGGNVLLVLLDDIGRDKVAAYGVHARPAHTPVMDGLEARGLRFDQAYTSPSCSPTRASILTGLRPSAHGVGRWIDPNDDRRGLRDDVVTIPELLRESPLGPWSSALVGKWHLSVFEPDVAFHPLDQGFDHHLGSLGNLDMRAEVRRRPGVRAYWDWEKNEDGALRRESGYATTVTTDDALAQLATLPEPFFLMVAYNAAHPPWHTPPSGLHTVAAPDSRVSNTDAMIESVDTELGRLLDGVDLETTTVFVLSDNGSDPLVTRDPWLDARTKDTPFDGGVHVPMWALGRAVEVVGRRTAALVDATDLFATVADLAGVSAERVVPEVDGVSLVPWLQDPDRVGRRCLITEGFPVEGRPGHQRDVGIHDGRWELVRMHDRDEVLIDTWRGEPGAQPDLLQAGLDPEARRAYDRLDAALARDR